MHSGTARWDCKGAELDDYLAVIQQHVIRLCRDECQGGLGGGEAVGAHDVHRHRYAVHATTHTRPLQLFRERAFLMHDAFHNAFIVHVSGSMF